MWPLDHHRLWCEKNVGAWGPGERANWDRVKRMLARQSKRWKRGERRREKRGGLLYDDLSACDYGLLLQLLPVSWLELCGEQRLGQWVTLEAPDLLP